MLAEVRFLVSKVQIMASIGCPEVIKENHDQGWLGREPTQDEQEVVSWMRSYNIRGQILHVGVGTSLLHKSFGSMVSQGITRDGGEATAARSAGLDVVVCNKYAVPSYRDKILGPFDCIVDVNIRSYACCDAHFMEYMRFLLSLLSPQGVLVTSNRGLQYLHPTSIKALRSLFTDCAVRCHGNVVVMRLRSDWNRKLINLWRALRSLLP